MGIIIGIRRFLKLDNAIVEFDKNIVDAAGLIMIEKKDFMKPPIKGISCCWPTYVSLHAKHNLQGCLHLNGHGDLHTDAVSHF